MKQPARVLLSLALLTGALMILEFRSAGEAVPARKPLASFPTAVGVWRENAGVALELGVLDMLKPTDYVMRRYDDPARRSIWMFIGYWDSQRKGFEPHSPRICLPLGGWEVLERSLVSIRVGDKSAPIDVNRFLVQKDRERMVVLYWFHSQGRAVAGEMAAKIETARNSLLRHRTDGALIRVTGSVSRTTEETSSALVEYIQAMYPVLSDFLPS
jgi:EpsI family protein